MAPDLTTVQLEIFHLYNGVKTIVKNPKLQILNFNLFLG